MPSAYALGIVSRNSILDFGVAERLRAFRYSFFHRWGHTWKRQLQRRLLRKRSAADIPAHCHTKQKAIVFAFLHQRWLRIGAADEARTRYLHLGKVALYQMSYGRISGAFIPAPSRAILTNFGAPAKICEAKVCGEKEKVLRLSRQSCFARPPDKRLDFRRGASDRNRTNDTGIFSPLLYRLSYRGKYDPDRARTDDPQRDRLVL